MGANTEMQWLRVPFLAGGDFQMPVLATFLE